MEDWDYISVEKEPQTPASSSHRNLYCDGCGGREFHADEDDGFYYCTECGSQSQQIIQTAIADEDFLSAGGIYNHRYTRTQSQNPNPNHKSKDQVNRELDRIFGVHALKTPKVENFVGFDDDEVSEPRDFGSVVCSDKEKLADGLRLRYVEGLQVMVQRQCEVLVEKFGVSPYIVGVVGSIWLKYVAATRVLADDWPEKAIKESEEAAKAAGRAQVVKEDYSKDLLSYLKHCKDVIFAGTSKSYKEERLIERLWDMYEKQENDGAKDEKKPKTEVSPNTSSDPNKGNEDISENTTQMEEDIIVKKHLTQEPFSFPNNPVSSVNIAVEKMKLEMEENGFEYLPPRSLQKIDLYLHYKRQRVDGKLVYVAHADYYMLLRACAKLAELDAQTMHRSVLSLERRLEWLDKKIDELF